MRISYAVSTMIFWWRENRLSFEQECQFILSMGFGIELWPNIKGLNECRYDRSNWPRLAAAIGDMPVTMRSRNDDPAIEQWAEQIECAKLLGADIVTDLKGFGVPDAADVNGCDFSEQIVELAEKFDVKLCLQTGDLAKLKQLGDKFDRLCYCLDIGYANIDPTFDFKQYVDELGPRIAHLHLTDNYGRKDDHQPPGLRGGIPHENWQYLLDSLNKYDNDVIAAFEMCPSMPAVMIRQGCEFLFDELNWPNRPQKQPDYSNIIYDPI